MKETFCQIAPDYSIRPTSEEYKEIVKNFYVNQIVRVKIHGTTKARSVKQNAWVHVAFKITSENSPDPDWNTPEKVKRNVKMAMKFFKDDVIVSGNKVFFELRSFAFDKMEQPEANRVFNHAIQVCADHLGVDVDSLKTEAMKE